MQGGGSCTLLRLTRSVQSAKGFIASLVSVDQQPGARSHVEDGNKAIEQYVFR